MKNIKNIGGRVWAWMNKAEANENEISFFDVKALYDAAYDEKAKARANIRRFRALLAQAEHLETAYRAQLAAARPGPAYLQKAA